MLGLENIVEFSNKNTIMKFLNSYLSLGLNSHGQNIFHSLIFAHLKKKFFGKIILIKISNRYRVHRQLIII